MQKERLLDGFSTRIVYPYPHIVKHPCVNEFPGMIGHEHREPADIQLDAVFIPGARALEVYLFLSYLISPL
jgi:hypothetical protein